MMKPNRLLSLTLIIWFALACGLVYADDGSGQTRETVNIVSLTVRSSVTSPPTNTAIVQNGIVVPNGAAAIKFAPDDVTGGENANRHILVFTLVADRQLALVSDPGGSGNSVPYVRMDIYDENVVGGLNQYQIPFNQFLTIAEPFNGNYRYRWRVNTLTDLGGLAFFGDLDQAATHRFPETLGNDDTVNALPATGMDLYLEIGNANNGLNVTVLSHNANSLIGVSRAYQSHDWFAYDSIEPKRTLGANDGLVTPSVPANYDLATQTWTPLDCTETIQFSVDVYDPYDPDFILNFAPLDPTITASGLDLTTATFWVGGVPFPAVDGGAGAGGPVNAEPSNIFTVTLSPTDFPGNGSYIVTFTIADLHGNIITFDNLGGPDGDAPNFVGADIQIDWDNDAVPTTGLGADVVTVNFTLPAFRTPDLLFPFDASADPIPTAPATPTGGGTGNYPDGTLGLLDFASISPVYPLDAAQYPAYGWMTADPAPPVWSATIPTVMDRDSPNVLNSQTMYILFEDADVDADLAALPILDTNGLAFAGTENLNDHGPAPLSYFTGLPGPINIVAGYLGGAGQLLITYEASPTYVDSIKAWMGADFGTLTLRYPADPVNGPFFTIAGCPITTPYEWEITFDGEGGNITPHNKGNEDLTIHDGDQDGTGDGGWEYGFAASALADSACTPPTPGDASQAQYSPHLSLPQEWEFTWELVAGAQQSAYFPSEILLGGFDVDPLAPTLSGYENTENALNGLPAGGGTPNGELQMVFTANPAYPGLNDGGLNPMNLRPTPSSDLVKVAIDGTVAANLPEVWATWNWFDPTGVNPPATEDRWVVTEANDLFGNPLTQTFFEESSVPGAGISGELFYLDFVTSTIEDVVISTTDPNTAVTEPVSPGPIIPDEGETIWIGIKASIGMGYEFPEPTEGTDPEDLFSTFNDAILDNEPLSFVFMDNVQSAACNGTNDHNFYYWDFFGYGDPDSADVIAPDTPREYYIWFQYTATGDELPGHYGIGVLATTFTGCSGGVYVDAASQWYNCSDMPISVEAGLDEAPPNNTDENYHVTNFGLTYNALPNLVPNYIYVPPPPRLLTWELQDLTDCTADINNGTSAGGNSSNAAIADSLEELLGGVLTIHPTSGPIDQYAIVVGNPKTGAAGDPLENVLPNAVDGASTFDATALTWFWLEPSDSSVFYAQATPADISVAFDINDLLAEGQVTDADGNPVTYTEAPDGLYQNIRIVVRNSMRPDVFDIWTPFGSHDQFGHGGSNGQEPLDGFGFNGVQPRNWTLDEEPPVITLDEPPAFAFADPNGGNFYWTNTVDVWDFPFVAEDSNPDAASGIADSWLQTRSPLGIQTTLAPHPNLGDVFAYTGALTDGDGQYRFLAYTEDNACNTSEADTMFVRLDSTPPALANAVETFDLNDVITNATTEAEFQVGIDFTPEIPNPYVPSLFALPNNDPNGNGGGTVYVYWRYGPVGVMPTGAYTLLDTFNLTMSSDGTLFTGDSDLELGVDVTEIGSGRYQFAAVFKDMAGNLTDPLPPVAPDQVMTSYIDVSVFGPNSLITDVQGEESICLEPDNEVLLLGTATNPEAQIVDPFVRLYYRVGASVGDESGEYVSVRSAIPGYVADFTHPIEDFETIEFQFTLTRDQLQTLAGTTDPSIIYFKTNAYGTGGAIEHTITGFTINVTTSDAAVAVASDPTTVFNNVEILSATPLISDGEPALIDFTADVSEFLEVDKVELWVDTPVSNTFQLADTKFYDPGIGNVVTDQFEYEFLLIVDGTYDFAVMAYTSCGLASALSIPASVCLDRGVPEPTLELADSSPFGVLNIDNPNVIATMTENPNDPDPACGPTTPQIYVRGPGETTYTAYPGAVLDFQATASGTYYFYGEVTDAAGNVGTTEILSIEADLDAPDIAWVSLKDGNVQNDCITPLADYTNDILVKARVSTTSDDVDRLNFDGDLVAPLGFNFIPSINYTIFLSAAEDGSEDGPKTVTVEAVDEAGNRSMLMPYTIELDQVPPNYVFEQPDPMAVNTASVVLDITDNTPYGGEANPYAMEIWYSQPGTPWMTLPDYVPTATSFEFVAPNGDGTYFLAVRGIDNAGNCGPAPVDPEATVIFDAAPPVTEIITDVPDCQMGDVSVMVNYEDMGENNDGETVVGSGVKRIELYQIANGGAPTIVKTRIFNPASAGPATVAMTYTPNQQGNLVLFTRATDLAGNVEAETDSVFFLRDTVNPVVGSSVNITSQPTELQILAEASVFDTYGLDHVDWYVNDDLVYTEDLTGTTATVNLEYLNLTEGGVYTVRMEVFDGCGNMATSQASITIDAQPPTAEITTFVDDCPTLPLNLTIEYQDDVIGVNTVQLWESINGSAPMSVATRSITPANVGPATTTISYNPTSEGNISLYVIAIDAYGNTQTPDGTTLDFTVDSVNPMVDSGIDITSQPDEAQIHATADVSDDQGLNRVEWSVNGQLVHTEELFGQTTATVELLHEVTQNGTYNITMRVYDQCDHFADATPASIPIDLAGPVSTILTEVTDCPTAPIQLEVEYSDDVSGVVAVHLWQRINNGAAQNVLTNTFAPNVGPATTVFNYTPTGQGTISLYTRAENAAGAMEDPKSPTVIFTYDTTPPTVSSGVTILSDDTDLNLQAQAVVSDTYGLGIAEWYVNDQLVDTQDLNGVNSSTVTLDHELLAGGVYEVGLTVYDECGNARVAPTATIAVDIVAPTSEITSNIPPCPTAPIIITVQYQDDVSGVSSIRLFESINGGTATAVLTNNFQVPNPGPSTTTFYYTPTGEGIISLYTIAQDANGNVETAPDDPISFTYGETAPVVNWDGYQGVDTVPEPDEALQPQIDVYFDSPVDLQSVSLYYRFRELQGTTFGAWTHYSTTGNPVNPFVSFNANGANAMGDEGYYQFQFIGTDECGNAGVLDSGTPSPTVLFEFIPEIDYRGNLTVTDANGNSVNMTFGTAPSATSGFDADLDEYAPTPNPNALYGYFAGLGFNLLDDFRPTNQTVTVWDLYVNAPSGQEPIMLSWTFDDLSGSTGLWLQDVTGQVISLDMRDQNFFYVPEGYEHLRIIQTNTHFPYLETGLPYTLVFTSVFIDGQMIQSGDEIGVFDGTLGVGSGVFDGQFNYSLAVWEADPDNDLPGFTNGNPIRYKVWDDSQQEVANCTANYSQGDGTFGFEPFSVLSLDCTHSDEICIDISPNQFNLISFNLDLLNTSVVDVFADLQNLEIVQTCSGEAYIPDYNVNTIGNVELGNAYLVYSSLPTAQQLCALGDALVQQPVLTLDPPDVHGWNCIAYLCDDAHPIQSALGDISASIEIVKTSAGGAWIPSLGVNTIGNMTPGTGYWVLLKSTVQNPIDFSYDCFGATTVRHDDQTQQSPTFSAGGHYTYETTGKPYHILLNSEPELAGIQLGNGDEVGVFDGDLCVGSVKLTGEYPLSIPVWEALVDMGVPGFTPGNEMSFRIWHNGQEYPVNAIYAQGSGEFNDGGFSMIQLTDLDIENADVASFSPEQLPTATHLKQNYPNPFNPSTHISFSLARQSAVKLSVYDVSGRLVKEIVNQTLEPGYYDFMWQARDMNGNDVPSGVYLYQLQTDEFSDMKRMVLLK